MCIRDRLRQAGGVTINNRNVSAKDYLGIVAAGTGEGDHYVYEATKDVYKRQVL